MNRHQRIRSRTVSVAAVAAFAVAGSVIAGSVAAAAPVGGETVAAPRPALTGVSTDRVAGANRYDTAARLSAQVRADSGSIVIANGSTAKQGFDALSANYLAGAGAVDAPILLTGAATLAPETADAIRTRLAASQAGSVQFLVMGKSDSVSDAVVAQLNAIAQQATGDTVDHVVRVAGDNRYATAVAAATMIGDDPDGALVGSYTMGAGSSLGKTAFLASGEANADALAAGPISNALHIPVYLTPASGLPTSVAGALTSQRIANLIVLGGTDRIPDTIVAQAKAAGVRIVQRIAGTDRYDTAARLYAFARSTLADGEGSHYGSGASRVYLANGTTGFPDALAVGPVAAQDQATLLTTPQGSLPSTTRDALRTMGSSVRSIVALGKDATIAGSVLQAARTALG